MLESQSVSTSIYRSYAYDQGNHLYFHGHVAQMAVLCLTLLYQQSGFVRWNSASYTFFHSLFGGECIGGSCLLACHLWARTQSAATVIPAYRRLHSPLQSSTENFTFCYNEESRHCYCNAFLILFSPSSLLPSLHPSLPPSLARTRAPHM